MNEPKTQYHRSRGITMVEALIVTVVFTIVLSGATVLMLRTERHLSEEAQRLVIEESAWGIMSRLTEELRSAYPDSVLPLVMNNSNVISFQRVVGFDGENVQLGPVITVQFNLDGSETANGLDDNSDGRVDEGMLVMNEPGEPTRTLAINVLGFRCNRTSTGVAFAADLGVITREGIPVERTFSHEVTFRN